MAVLLVRFRLEAAFMPMRRSRPAVVVRLLWALLTRPISMLGLHQVYALTSLSTTQTRALAASSLMLRRARLDSRLVHRVGAITKSRPRMALSEFVARSDAEGDVVAMLEGSGAYTHPGWTRTPRRGTKRTDQSSTTLIHDYCATIRHDA